MEDIRKLITDREANVAPESMAYRLRGLTAVVHDMVANGAPSDSRERLRYNEMLHACAHCAEFYGVLLARWVSRHSDECS